MAASCRSLENMAQKAKISGSYTQWAKYLYQITDQCSPAAVAANNLGNLYLRGTGVSQNTQTAIFYFIKSAKEGRENDFTATSWGEPEASIGWIYFTGEYPNAPKDLSKAFTWSRRAAEKGHPIGLSNLALMYGAGIGVRKDEAEALELLAKSVEAFSPELTWLLDKPDEWLKPEFKDRLSPKMLKARDLYWEGLRYSTTRRSEVVSAIKLLSSSTASSNSAKAKSPPEMSGLIAQISKSTLLECAPEKSAARIEEVFGWPKSYWDNGDAPTALATELLFPGGALAPPCSYETFVVLLQRGVALGNPFAYELQAVSHALGAGFQPRSKDIEYWLYRAQKGGLTRDSSVLTPFRKQIADQVRWNPEISELIYQHFFVQSDLVGKFQAEQRQYSDQSEMEAAAKRGNHGATYNLAVRAYGARKYDEAMEHLRSIRGKYPTAYLESVLLDIPIDQTSWDEVVRKRQRVNEIFEDLPEEKRASVLFTRAKLEMASQSVIARGSLSTLAIRNLAEAAEKGEADAAYLLALINTARAREGISQFGDSSIGFETREASTFLATSIVIFERVMADLRVGEKNAKIASVLAKIRAYLPSDPERRDPIARWLLGQVMTEPPQGLARLLIDLFESEWFSVLDGKEELVALKMLIGRNAPSEEISREELLGWLTELEGFSARGCSYCRSELALGLLKVGSSDPERLGRAFEWLGETVRRDGSAEYEPVLSALGEALSQVLIKGLQESLQRSGYYQGAIDGKFGNGTRSAAESLALDVGVPLSSPPSFESESAFDWLESASDMASDAALESDGSCASAIGDKKAQGVLCASFAN